MKALSPLVYLIKGNLRLRSILYFEGMASNHYSQFWKLWFH